MAQALVGVLRKYQLPIRKRNETAHTRLVLIFLAPVTAEYLSGSAPLSNPIILAANILLYGCGALMIRELKARWHKGWAAVFILSIAYRTRNRRRVPCRSPSRS